MPDPDTLAKYAETIPDGAERIMKMAEKEQDFRHDFASKRLRRELNQSGMGQILAFILSVTAISGGIFLAYMGKDTAGITTIISAMALLAGAFIAGRFGKKAEE